MLCKKCVTIALLFYNILVEVSRSCLFFIPLYLCNKKSVWKDIHVLAETKQWMKMETINKISKERPLFLCWINHFLNWRNYIVILNNMEYLHSWSIRPKRDIATTKMTISLELPSSLFPWNCWKDPWAWKLGCYGF